MDITIIIKNHSTKVRQHIIKLLNYLEDQMLLTKFDEAHDVQNILADFIVSGKLIRGGLYLYMSQVYGHKNIDSLLDIAAAIEINHSGLLIHDDVMDNDVLRRGQASVHTLYSESAVNFGIINKENYGKSMAICIGDICFFAANFCMGNSRVSKKIVKDLSAYYNLQMMKTGLGQMSDLRYSFSSQDPKLTEILKIYHYKTANYTFNVPLVMGYLTSGQSGLKEIALLEKIGYSLGIIYQITDDLIGFTKDKEIIGKDAGSDIRENKKTIIRYFMLKQLNATELDFAFSCYGNRNLTITDLQKLRNIFYKRKIYESINQLIEKESIKAKKNIFKLNLKGEYKEQIISFIKYLVNRIK